MSDEIVVANINRLVAIGAEAGKAYKNTNNFGLAELKTMAKYLKLPSSKDKATLVESIINKAKASVVGVQTPAAVIGVSGVKFCMPWTISKLVDGTSWADFANQTIPYQDDEGLIARIINTPLERNYVVLAGRQPDYSDYNEKFGRKLNGHSLDLLVQYVWLRVSNLVNQKVSNGQEGYLTQEKFVQCIFYDVLHEVVKSLGTTNRVLAEDTFPLLQLEHDAKYYPEDNHSLKKGVRRIDVSITGRMHENDEGELVETQHAEFRVASFELKVARAGFMNSFYEDIIRQAMLVADNHSARSGVLYGIQTGYVVVTGAVAAVRTVELESVLDVKDLIKLTGNFTVDLPRYIVPLLVLDTCDFDVEFSVRVWRLMPHAMHWLSRS